MSALTTIFNYLYAYLVAILGIVLGVNIGPLKNETVNNIVTNISVYIASTLTPEQIENLVKVRPILWLSIGIFACGAVIGLTRRLIR